MNKPKYKLETAFSKLQSKKGSKKSKATPRDHFWEDLHTYLSRPLAEPSPTPVFDFLESYRRPSSHFLRYSAGLDPTVTPFSHYWFDDEVTT